MVRALHLYVDDSGNRHPDHLTTGSRGPEWFGLGGLIVADNDEAVVRERIQQFRDRWKHRIGDAPLHSHKIRHQSGVFSWMVSAPADAIQFRRELTELIVGSPLLCNACVIDRSGYLRRYTPVYSLQDRWSLCKTAFAILLERTAKFARREGRVLRVYVERSAKTTDRMMLQHYNDLRTIGMPFSVSTMQCYAPLDAAALRDTLYEFKTKMKTSPMIQLADLCLYPMCRGGYDQRGQDYVALRDGGKLLDSVLAPDEILSCGVKYSCFTTPLLIEPVGASEQL